MQEISKIDPSDITDIYVAPFQDINTFIPYLNMWHLTWYFLPDFSHVSGDCQFHVDYLIPHQTTLQTAQISHIC